MSFSSSAKSDICTLPLKKEHCLRAELSGMLFTGSSIMLDSQGLHLILLNENAPVARRIFSIIKKLYGISCELSVKDSQLKKKHTYVTKITGKNEVFKILRDSGLIMSGGIRVNNARLNRILEKNCCKIAFLRGAFLLSGSVCNPNKNYHLEFVVDIEDLAYPLLNILNIFDLNAKMSTRKSGFIVYLKEIDHIIKLLTLIGAHQSILEMENIRIIKETRNSVNRQINCDQANINKMVTAAFHQIENIQYIANTVGFSNLPNNLRETAELRLSYPEASLSELAEHLGDGVTKSGINHRLRRINEIAQQLKDSKED